MYKVYIIVGEECVENFRWGITDNINLDNVKCLRFNSVDEKNAFCKGVHTAARYDDYSFIDKDEYEFLKKRLS